MKKPTGSALLSLAAGVMMFSSSAVSQDASRVKSDAESWVRDAQTIYRLDCESKKKIWEALCGLLDPGLASEIAHQSTGFGDQQ